MLSTTVSYPFSKEVLLTTIGNYVSLLLLQLVRALGAVCRCNCVVSAGGCGSSQSSNTLCVPVDRFRGNTNLDDLVDQLTREWYVG